MKRKIIYISLLMSTLSVFQACKQDFLEIEPKTNLLDANFYKTEGDALKAVVAVYDGLSVQNWDIVPLMSDIWSDDAYKGGANAPDMQEYGNIELQMSNPTDVNSVTNLWNKCYSGIYRANIYLSKEEGIKFDSIPNKKRFTAEVKFLRAYFYWDLVRHYGWVPIITAPNSDVESYKNLKQNTPEEVYKQIAIDLLDALKDLPTKALPNSEAGRVTKYAAEGLLARIFLFYDGFVRNTQELGVGSAWSNGSITIDKAYAQAAIDDIIAQPQYKLLTDYSQLFDWKHQNSSEGIFEWQYSELGKSDDWSGWNVDGNWMCQYVGIRDPKGDPTLSSGYSLGTISWSLLNEFEPGDPRLKATIYDANTVMGKDKYTHGYQNTGYFNYKFTPRSEFNPSAGQATMNYPENFPDIRLADVLLMGSELYLQDNPSKATGYLNQVRTRAMGQSAAKASITLDDIKHERRVELACEGSRKWDLMRWGLTYAKTMIDKTFDPAQISDKAESMDQYPTTGYLNVNTLGMFPIPATEISKANTGVLKQFIPAYQ